jgi:hypothetical protein
MGHRASYAIRSRGEIELFYSHWGALTVPHDIFWGPTHAEEFVRLQGQSEEWLDDVFGEGGVALDKDTRVAAWYGGEALAHPPLIDAFVPLIAAVWSRSGWTLRAVSGMPDIAEHVGLDRSIAEADPLPPSPNELTTVLDPSWSVRAVTLLTLIDGGRAWDVMSGTDAAHLLVHGSALVAAVPDHPDVERTLRFEAERELRTWERERRPLGPRITSAVSIDTAKKRITCQSPRSNGKLRRAAALAWPGYRVEFHEGGLEAHFRASDRAVPDVLKGAFAPRARVPVAEALSAHLDDVMAELLREHTTSGADLVRQLLDEQRAEGHEVNVNPHALQPVVRKPLSEAERMRIVSTAVADLLSRVPS